MHFRTLTEKSKLGFGKNHDLKVQSVINKGDVSYLRWCYFNCSHISFVEDILKKLCITPEYRICKPGTDNMKGILLEDELKALFRSQVKTQAEIFKYSGIKKKLKKRAVVNVAMREKMYTSSAISMQRNNQGHRNDFNR